MNQAINHLASSPKGWRFRRVSETIALGDLRPVGISWEPVSDGLIGTQVLGMRDTPTGEIELIATPRKRRLSAAQEKVILDRRFTGTPAPVVP